MTAGRTEAPLARLRRKVREVGPLYAVQRAMTRVLPTWLFYLNVFVVLKVELSHYAGARAADSGLRWAGPADLAALARFGGADYIAARFERGEAVAVLEQDGEIVGWHAHAARYDQQSGWFRLDLGPEEVFFTMVIVAPEHRGRGLGHRIMDFALREVAGQGYERVYFIVDALNRNSLKAFSRIESRPAGRIAYVRLLGLTVVKIGSRVRCGFWSPDRPLRVPRSWLAGPAEGRTS